MSIKYCVYFGTVRGVIGSASCTNGELAKYEFQDTSQSSEVTCLEWGRSENEIIIGHKNGTAKLYDSLKSLYTNDITEINGKGAIVGACAVDENLIVACKSGHINIWNNDYNDYFSLNLSEDSTLENICHNKFRKNIIATGGQENDLKLWDIETKKCVFKAKSMGHDHLNLPIPTSIRDISFLDNEDKLTSCCTKEGHVLLYDDRVQRRPVSKFLEPKASYTVIRSACKERQCLVGTTKGYMQLLDLKSPAKCVKTFTSFTGSVSSIAYDPIASNVATVSLDRYLRIHNLETKELLYKEYLKQSLTKVIIRPIVKEESETAEQDEVNLRDGSEADEEYEELFENMQTITDYKTSKTSKRSLQDSAVKIHKKTKKKKRVVE